jgi:hypothetical protein
MFTVINGWAGSGYVAEVLKEAMQSSIGILPVRLAVTRWTRRGQAGSLCYIAREASLRSKWSLGRGNVSACRRVGE